MVVDLSKEGHDSPKADDHMMVVEAMIEEAKLVISLKRGKTISKNSGVLKNFKKFLLLNKYISISEYRRYGQG